MRDLPPNMTDYLQTRASFRLEVPEVYNYARDVVDAWAAREPGKLALLAVGPDGGDPRRFSFADLAASSNRAANFLAARGLRKGDRVFVMLPRIPEWYDVVLGCIKLGAVPVPGTTLLTARDIAYRLERAGATAAVTDAEGVSKVDVAAEPLGLEPLERLWVGDPEAGDAVPQGWSSWASGLEEASERPPDVEPTRADDPLLIYFTSGTVAYPKMVLHTQASLGIGHQITARFWQDLKPSDLHWTLSDFGWAKAAWGKLFGQWALGAANFLWDLRGKPDFDLMLRLIGRHGVSTFCAPPTVYRGLVQLDLGAYDWSGLRHCVSAGERVKPERPVGLFREYWRDPEATAGAFRGDWYYTGDRAEVDEDCYFWFVGRSDDVIISSAYRIGPFEVESALVEHVAVAEAAVVGKPDPDRGQIVKAFVILAPGHTGSEALVLELQDHCKRVSAPYKYPREIEFVDELPKTISGKIRRVELRERENTGTISTDS